MTDRTADRWFWTRWVAAASLVLFVQVVAGLMVAAVVAGPRSMVPPETMIASGAAGLTFVAGWVCLVGSSLAIRRREPSAAWLWMRYALGTDMLLLVASLPLVFAAVTDPVLC